MNECKSFDSTKNICMDGFIQKPFCSGNIGCVSCGNINQKEIPYCMRDEVPKVHANEDGSPKYYKS